MIKNFVLLKDRFSGRTRVSFRTAELKLSGNDLFSNALTRRAVVLKRSARVAGGRRCSANFLESTGCVVATWHFRVESEQTAHIGRQRQINKNVNLSVCVKIKNKFDLFFGGSELRRTKNFLFRLGVRLSTYRKGF